MGPFARCIAMAVVWLPRHREFRCPYFHSWQIPKECARGSLVGLVKKACVLLIQALDAYTQTKFQSYCCPLIIARDFGTLFLWGRAGKAFFAKGVYPVSPGN